MIEAGLVRFRPMLLTTLAVEAGSLASLVTAPALVPFLYVLQRKWLG